ncbi:amidohydrolase [Sciscionella sediminilitoris]|uniref:amidohydrolase n=1 Tax=Sciscionella sediminilitoris TaxID=1445613 RepID=UPI0004DEF194|nr:amidohydrolase [Sciscionella sp. SE31]
MIRYVNGKLFTADPGQPWASALVVTGDRLGYVGDEQGARHHAPEATEVDLEGRTVLPGFVDGHVHLLMAGAAQLQAHLTDAGDLAEIQRRVRDWARDNPDAPRVLGRGWLFDAVPEGRPTRDMLDTVVPDRPVYLDANDYHSVWVNSAALAELGIDANTPDPVGGRVDRDPVTGEPSGHLVETAAQDLVWPFLEDVSTDAERDRALAAATRAYQESGVTGVVDMALDEHGLAALERAGEPGMRIAAHWLISRNRDPLEQVRRAAELAERHHTGRLRVVGVKFIVDGVIDGCTASMNTPYVDGSNAEAIWEPEALAPAVAAADAAGLQIALHAIGDRSVRIALDALEHAARVNGPRTRRHRIEHLEYVDPADVPRLAELGVTASMQPVHADPAIRPNWAAMLGPGRAERGFAWPEFTAAGARLVFGTDAPTAPHPPLPNMFIANTRRSALSPELPALQPEFALELGEAITHASADSAWACGAEHDQGSLRAGLFADFVVLDRDPFAGPEELLRADCVRTVLGGKTVFSD